MSIPASIIPSVCSIDRGHFSSGFTFGTASSAFQYEGAAKEGGRGPSIWDTYCTEKGLLLGNAIDQYHRYKEDVALMKWMGLDAYRFSISWSRILPDGTKSGGVNPEGVKYYKNLIDELHANGIKPYVTLFHWDVPQALEVEYGGFLSREIIEDFKDYADICFAEFGNKVKHWITLNEPWSFSEGGYASGTLAPGHGDVSDKTTSATTRNLRAPTAFSFNPVPPRTSGDPATEPYLVTHHQLLAHAIVVELYRRKYKKRQGGEIGLSLNSVWVEPFDPKKDLEAKERSLDFTLNWFLDPILFGDYPASVQKIIRERKIKEAVFSNDESKLMRKSIDFLGINYYTASYVRDASHVPINGNPSYTTDSKVEYPPKFLLGDDWGAVSWLKVYPQGLRDLLCYVNNKIKKEYKKDPMPPTIYITENGYGENNDNTLSLHEVLHDEKRVLYHHQHLSCLLEAINKFKVDVKGYFSWSLMDNFEWAAGFSTRFGNIYIDFKDDLKRHPKFSAHWFKFILHKNKKSSGGLIGTNASMLKANVKLIGLTHDPFRLENGYVEEGDNDPIELENGSVEEGDTLKIVKLGLTHDPIELKNGSVEELGDPLEANKDLGSDVNSDPTLGSVEDPQIKSA